MRIFYCLLFLLAVPMVRAGETASAQLKAVGDLIAKYSQKIYQGTSRTDEGIAALVEEAKMLKAELEQCVEERSKAEGRIQSADELLEMMASAPARAKAKLAEILPVYEEEQKGYRAALKRYKQGQLGFDLPEEEAAFKATQEEYMRLEAWWQRLRELRSELEDTLTAMNPEGSDLFKMAQTTIATAKQQITDQGAMLENLVDRGRDLRRRLNALGAIKLRSIQSDKPRRSAEVPKSEAK